MSESLTLKIKGLFTSFNEFSEAPEGSLLVADNIDILQDSIAEPRRGLDRPTGAFSDSTYRASTILEFQNTRLAHYGSTIGTGTQLAYLSAGVWTSLGSFSAPANSRIKYLTANQNLYMTSSSGVKKLTAYNGTVVASGVAKGLDVTAALSASASTWLLTNYRTAYRIVWGYKDVHQNLLLGAPSQRESFKNTSGSTKALDLTVTIPATATVDWFVQVYRAAAVDVSVTDVEPNDEMGLVYEAHPTSGEISARSMVITDIVPDSLRGATIYTASSQEGLANQNEQPPLATDIALFRDNVFFGNTTLKHRFFLTLLAVGSPNGVVNDDTITIGGVVYTGKGSETTASGQFKVTTGGSAASNITDTALSLVRTINRYASSTVYAYYLSSGSDLPGKILLEERSIGGAAFVIISSRSTCWSPGTIAPSGTATVSTNDAFQNSIMWSKANQPESAPIVNRAFVGSRDHAISRIIPLREALYIFKDNEGIFKLSGYFPNFQIDKLDSSANLLIPESCQVLNNQIFCYTDQGVTIVSDSTKVISRPVEQDLLELINNNLAVISTIGFGVSYESDRKYYLFVPTSDGDTYPTQAFVYNSFTNTWVKHLVSATCGFVGMDRRLILGSGVDAYLREERKTYTSLDYVDFGTLTTITASTGRIITIASGPDVVATGDIIYQSSSVFAEVESVDPITGDITLTTAPGFTLAAVTVYKAIQTAISWVPMSLSNPGIQKQFHTVTVLCKRVFNGSATISFKSDLSPSEIVAPLTGRSLGFWGLFPWGTLPWGGAPIPASITQWVPRARQRASQLTMTFRHAVGFSAWKITGIALFGTPGSEKIGR